MKVVRLFQQGLCRYLTRARTLSCSLSVSLGLSLILCLILSLILLAFHFLSHFLCLSGFLVLSLFECVMRDHFFPRTRPPVMNNRSRTLSLSPCFDRALMLRARNLKESFSAENERISCSRLCTAARQIQSTSSMCNGKKQQHFWQ